jgi:hypothetical protein
MNIKKKDEKREENGISRTTFKKQMGIMVSSGR